MIIKFKHFTDNYDNDCIKIYYGKKSKIFNSIRNEDHLWDLIYDYFSFNDSLLSEIESYTDSDDYYELGAFMGWYR